MDGWSSDNLCRPRVSADRSPGPRPPASTVPPQARRASDCHPRTAPCCSPTPTSHWRIDCRWAPAPGSCQTGSWPSAWTIRTGPGRHHPARLPQGPHHRRERDAQQALGLAAGAVAGAPGADPKQGRTGGTGDAVDPVRSRPLRQGGHHAVQPWAGDGMGGPRPSGPDRSRRHAGRRGQQPVAGRPTAHPDHFHLACTV